MGAGSLYPRFSDQEYARRHRLLREAMKGAGLDALVLWGGPGAAEISWVVNYVPHSPCWLVFPREGRITCFVHFYNHIPAAKAQAIIDDVRWYGPSPAETVAEHLRGEGFGDRAIGVVTLNAMPHAHYVGLTRRLPEAKFTEFGREFNRIRWVRSEEEQVFVKKSGHLTDLVCEALEARLRPGQSEHDILAIVYDAYARHGGDPQVHFIASTPMAKPDRFVPWQRMTNRTIDVGSVVITELTVSYWGYATQIHRPFAIGRPPTPLYQELFDAALECFERVRRLCRPGVTSEEIVAAASVIEERGFTTYDSVFHGERGKFPELGTRSAVHPLEPWTLVENMVHVIQPNPITRDHTAGLQLGAAVLVTPAGGELLHHYPFKFPVCGA